MKRIYLVRHGESEGNVRNEIGGKDFKLSDHGQMQAAQLAERITHLDIQKLVVSDFVRAQQTMVPTATVTQLEPEVVSAFGEMMDATSFFGLRDDDPVVLENWSVRNKHITNPDYRFEDAENFFDLFERINSAREYLEKIESESVLVVSHAFFLSCFIAAILLDIKEPDENFLKIVTSVQMNNTGITYLTFDDGKWKLVILNDHAHFAE